MKPDSRIQKWLIYGAFLIISILFLTAFSLWESPLYTHWYGCDASFFSMCGRGILNGWVPYRDFFDLKGPYFFFLQAIGQLLHADRLGVFLLEIPFLFASLILIYEIGRLFVSHAKSMAILLITLFMHVTTLWGGNALEEYTLPLNLLVVYLTLRFAIRPAVSTSENPTDADKHGLLPDIDYSGLPWCVPYVTGVIFGIIAFSKITVAAPLAGVVIAVCLNLLIERNWKRLGCYLGFALLGVVTSVAPIMIYFYCHDSLSRMLYCVFAFALKRSVDFSEPFNFTWELKTFGCYFAVLTALLHPKKLGRKYITLLLSMALITYVLLHLGVPFIYYFITVFPIFILAMAIFLRLYNPLIVFSGWKQFICLAALSMMLYYYTGASLDTIDTFLFGRGNTWYENDYQGALDLGSLIPENERDQVFSFSIDMTWFEANRILPCNPYQVNLQFFIALDPSIEEELTAYLNEKPPKWLIIGDSFKDSIPSLYQIVDSKYECICSNNAGNLYLLQ